MVNQDRSIVLLKKPPQATGILLQRLCQYLELSGQFRNRSLSVKQPTGDVYSIRMVGLDPTEFLDSPLHLAAESLERGDQLWLQLRPQFRRQCRAFRGRSGPMKRP